MAASAAHLTPGIETITAQNQRDTGLPLDPRPRSVHDARDSRVSSGACVFERYNDVAVNARGKTMKQITHLRAIFRVRRASTAFAMVGLLAITTTTSAGCISKRPNQNQCNEFVDHLVALMKKAGHPASKADKLAKDKVRDDMVDECTMRGTLSEVRCSMQQSTLADITKNCK